MIINYIAPVTFLEIEKLNGVLSINGLGFTTHRPYIEQLIVDTDSFTHLYGTKGLGELLNNPCIAMTISDSSAFSKSNNLQQINYQLDNIKFLALNCLWLIKDNSINAHLSYVQSPEIDSVSSIIKKNNFSNSSGGHSSVFYSNEEIGTLNNLIPKVSELFYPPIIETDDNCVEDNYVEKAVITIGVNKIAADRNRLARAMQFLHVARSTSELPMKISFYMALLECLFSSNHNEIQYQLSERVALFLGGDKKTKIDNFDYVKAAYNIRSSLMHGSNIKKTDNEIITISIRIDSLIREIFLKIINGESAVFQPKTKSDSCADALTDYFKQLIFADNSY